MPTFTLHPHLASSARWHGKRVGRALAAGDARTAAYESDWFKRSLAVMAVFEQDAANAIYSRCVSDELSR